MIRLFLPDKINKNSHAILDTTNANITEINQVLNHYRIPEISYA